MTIFLSCKKETEQEIIKEVPMPSAWNLSLIKDIPSLSSGDKIDLYVHPKLVLKYALDTILTLEDGKKYQPALDYIKVFVGEIEVSGVVKIDVTKRVLEFITNDLLPANKTVTIKYALYWKVFENNVWKRAISLILRITS